jgi:formate dehydrogenase
MTTASAQSGRTGTFPSYCRICESICGILVQVEQGRAVKIVGDPDHPVSKGYMCPKAGAFARVSADPDRVITPMRRCGGPGEFEPVGWDEALDDIAGTLKRIRRQHGPHAIAMYLGNPASFSTGHLMWCKGFLDAIGSRNFYSGAAQDGFPRQVASQFLYSSPFLFPIPDIPHTDFLLVLGANPAVSHGSLITLPRMRFEMRDVVERGGRVVIVDPVRTKTAEMFEHVPIRPGTDALLLAAMIGVLFTEDLVDAAAEKVAIGLEALRAAVEPVTPERAASATGIPAETIVSLARDFAAASSAAPYSRTGLCRAPNTTVANYLVDALAILTGNFDRRGGLLFGDAPIDLAGLAARSGMGTYGKHRTRIGGLPDVAGNLPWVLPQEILTPGQDQVCALIVAGGNPVLSAPEGDLLERGLAGLELLVSCDLYVNETNKHAHYVLPGPTFLEREDVPLPWLGHMPRPFIQAATVVVKPPDGVREEWWTYDQLARRMGLGAPFGQRSLRIAGRLGLRVTPRRVTDLLLRTCKRGDWFGLRPGGLSLRRLEAEPHGMSLAERLPTGRAGHHIKHADKLVRLGSPEVLAQLEAAWPQPSADFPLGLIGRRQMHSINSWLHNVETPRGRESATLWVHPLDATELELVDGGQATVRSTVGEVVVTVEITTRIVRGAVSYPHGWGHAGGWKTANRHAGANINRILPAGVESKDPLSGASFLDGVPVAVASSRGVHG